MYNWQFFYLEMGLTHHLLGLKVENTLKMLSKSSHALYKFYLRLHVYKVKVYFLTQLKKTLTEEAEATDWLKWSLGHNN